MIATLGFDERHVIRSLLAIGLEGIEYIILLIPDWPMDERTTRAVNEITKIASLAGISEENIVLKKIPVEDFWSSIAAIVKVFIEYYKAGIEEYVLSIGGGLRVLVVEAYTATLFLPEYIASKVTVRIDLESRKSSVVVRRENIPLQLWFTPRPQEIDVLGALCMGEYSLTSLSKELGLPKSTLWKILKRLEEKRLVYRTGNVYRTTDLGRILYGIFSKAYN